MENDEKGSAATERSINDQLQRIENDYKNQSETNAEKEKENLNKKEKISENCINQVKNHIFNEQTLGNEEFFFNDNDNNLTITDCIFYKNVNFIIVHKSFSVTLLSNIFHENASFVCYGDAKINIQKCFFHKTSNFELNDYNDFIFEKNVCLKVATFKTNKKINFNNRKNTFYEDKIVIPQVISQNIYKCS